MARIAIGDMDIQAHTIDLSQGGLAIATSYNIPQGAILSLRFDLTKMDEKGMASFYQTVKVAGEVRSNIKLNNKDEYRLGISFKKIDEEDKAIIAESVNMSLGR